MDLDFCYSFLFAKSSYHEWEQVHDGRLHRSGKLYCEVMLLSTGIPQFGSVTSEASGVMWNGEKSVCMWNGKWAVADLEAVWSLHIAEGKDVPGMSESGSWNRDFIIVFMDFPRCLARRSNDVRARGADPKIISLYFIDTISALGHIFMI